MFLLSQFALNNFKTCDTSDKLATYSIITGLVLYSSTYLYVLFYKNEYLGIFNKFIIYIITIDLLLSTAYHLLVVKKQTNKLENEKALEEVSGLLENKDDEEDESEDESKDESEDESECTNTTISENSVHSTELKEIPIKNMRMNDNYLIREDPSFKILLREPNQATNYIEELQEEEQQHLLEQQQLVQQQYLLEQRQLAQQQRFLEQQQLVQQQQQMEKQRLQEQQQLEEYETQTQTEQPLEQQEVPIEQRKIRREMLRELKETHAQQDSQQESQQELQQESHQELQTPVKKTRRRKIVI